MLRHAHGSAVPSKQTLSDLGQHSASITGECQAAALKKRNRPNITACSAPIARVEGFVEALAALIGTAQFEEEQERANNAIIRARICVRGKFDTGYLSADERDAIDCRIDHAEVRISESIRIHRTRIAHVVVPEVRRCAQIADAA